MARGNRDQLRWRIGISVLLILLFLAAGVGAFRLLLGLKKSPGQGEGARPRIVVRVERAARQDWPETLGGYGRARTLRSAGVAAEVSGTVRTVSPRLEAGAEVEKAEELLRIDDRDYQQALTAAKARLSQATSTRGRIETDLVNLGRRLTISREDLEASERELERIRGLTETGVQTLSELDRQRMATSLRRKEVIEIENQQASLEKEAARAKAEEDAARAAFERAENDLDRTVVRAPWTGRIESRRISVGARVAPGTVLFDLVDLSAVEVPVALGASHYAEVAVGAGAKLRLREGGPVVWEGTVDRISPVVDPENRTFFAYLVVRGDGGHAPVPPGAFVVAEVDGPVHAGVIPVPRTAFVTDRIFLADPEGDGLAAIRTVTPKVFRWISSVALVTEGIAEGDRIVVTNIEQVAEGSRVRLVEDGEAEAGAR